MKRKNDSQNYFDWFEKGNHDLGSAELIFKEEGFTDTICFLCQQAVEKYLKGYLSAKSSRIKKVHDLVQLLNQCQAIDKGFKRFSREANFLTSFYIGTRYPINPPVIYPMSTAKQAIAAAIKMINFITDKLTKQ